MRIRLGFLLIVATLGGQALAAPFTVAYEGNDFPENEGWNRVTTAGGADRRVEDGVLVLDGRSSVEIADYYARGDRPLSLEPNEAFFAEWRFSLQDLNGRADPSVAIESVNGRVLAIQFSRAEVLFPLTGESVAVSLDGLVTFRLVSDDFQTFELFADHELVFSGQFRPLIPLRSRVAWGDGIEGASSLTYWDYFRFGVIPEPSGGLLLIALVTVQSRRSR